MLVICGYNCNVDSTQVTESGLTGELQSVYVMSQPDKAYDIVVFGTVSQCVAVESCITGDVQNQSVVKNYTSVVDNILDIDHDIDESTNVGKTTCVVEPGKLIRIDQSSDYVGVDTYKAQFCHKGIIGFKDYNDNEQSYDVVFSVS